MKILQNEIRAFVFYEEDGEDRIIQINNPGGKQKEKLVKFIQDGIENKKNKKTQLEILEYMIDNFTNAELGIPLAQIDLESNELSHELKSVLRYMQIMQHEIAQDLLLSMRAKVTQDLTKEYELLLADDIKELRDARFKRKNKKKNKK